MIHFKIIDLIIAIFMTMGVFGNVNVIVAIVRKKVLRTKHGMLILFLSIAHLGCNISELIDLLKHLQYIIVLSYRRCFKYGIIYSFFMDFQFFLYLPIALDVFLSIVIPIKYKLWNKTCYILAMLIFPIGLSVFYKIVSIYHPPESMSYCLNVLLPDPPQYTVLVDLIVFCNMTTIFIIIVSVFCAMRKSKSMHSSSSRSDKFEEENVKLFRSTFFIVVFHVGSWLLIIFAHVIHNSIQTYWISVYGPLIVVPNFCQTFYVTYFRSSKFRKAYQEQIHWMTCGKLFPNIFKTEESRVISTPNLENNDEDCDDTLNRGQI